MAVYWDSSLSIIKDRRQSVLICSPVTPGFEVISVHLSFSPLGNSNPACNSATFIHIPLEIHPHVLLHLLPVPIHPMSFCTLGEAFTSYQHHPHSHRLFLRFYSSSPLVRHGSWKWVFPIPLPKEKKPKRLSMRIMVSQMNSVQELGFIEKTQAWFARWRWSIVSLLNCANVSRTGKRERQRGKY